MWRNPGEIAGNNIDDDHNGYVDDVYGIDTVNHDSNPIDDHGHGTHTSGTIAAVGNNATGVTGVNWNARILACKFLNGSGSGSEAGAIECFNYIVALKKRGQNIRVSNNSWGALRGGSISQALKDAMDAAGAEGILNVCAAGNNAVEQRCSSVRPGQFRLVKHCLGRSLQSVRQQGCLQQLRCHERRSRRTRRRYPQHTEQRRLRLLVRHEHGRAACGRRRRAAGLA